VLPGQVEEGLAHGGALGDADRLLGHRLLAHRHQPLLHGDHPLLHLAQLSRLAAASPQGLQRPQPIGGQHLRTPQGLLCQPLRLLGLQLLLPLALELPLELHRQQPLALGVLGGHVAAP